MMTVYKLSDLNKRNVFPHSLGCNKSQVRVLEKLVVLAEREALPAGFTSLTVLSL